MDFDWQKLLQGTVNSALASAFPQNTPQQVTASPVQVLQPAPSSSSTSLDMKTVLLWGGAALAVVATLFLVLRK